MKKIEIVYLFLKLIMLEYFILFKKFDFIEKKNKN